MFEVFQKYLADKISLTEDELAMIKAVSAIKKLRKKQYLLQEGDVWRNNAFVCQGCLRTYHINDKGAEHIMGFSIENWWVGDRESLSSGNPSRYNIDALEDSTVLLINKDNFDSLCKKLPHFNDLINSILHRGFLAAQNRIHDAISYSAEEKYQNFVNKYPAIHNRVPQHMIASYLGIKPETLSRIRNLAAKK